MDSLFTKICTIIFSVNIITLTDIYSFRSHVVYDLSTVIPLYISINTAAIYRKTRDEDLCMDD